jgi:hypothetical protein
LKGLNIWIQPKKQLPAFLNSLAHLRSNSPEELVKLSGQRSELPKSFKKISSPSRGRIKVGVNSRMAHSEKTFFHALLYAIESPSLLSPPARGGEDFYFGFGTLDLQSSTKVKDD